ncbi:MAG: hypothetical protein FWB96_12655 [Defluviitaleaceae bacterium]|nr:hypothetical protein [Defluviitaleaceae bacterium]MCL2263989.1 hypothetical protein [Defluviitaleaceae bacterium]
MRVTNHMIFGNSMNNIWRNARHINKLVTKQETGYRIQRPSDDPLISARAMRYRTILSEAEQFLRNVHQGLAWMEVSESAFNNILSGNTTNPSLMQRMNVQLIKGAQTGTQQLEDQRAIIAEIQQYFDQMFNVDINQTYLGRYVFSGFHTNQPPVLSQNWPGSSFVITQNFTTVDIERATAFHRPNPTARAEAIWTNIIKLPYTNVSFADHGVAGAPIPQITLADGTVLHIENRISTEYDAYRPEDSFTNLLGEEVPVIHNITDTGELVFSDAVRELIHNAGGIRVVYEKSDLRAGELNPIVYFESTQIRDDSNVHFNTPVHFNTDGQNIQMEISANSYVTINSHARNILTANLFSDLRRLFDFADSLVSSDPSVIREYFRNEHGYEGEALTNAVAEFLSNEQAAFSGAIHTRFNNMMEAFARHSAQAQREHTALGSRMARLDMVAIRLEEDEVAFTELLSDNEDADLIETMKRKNAAETAFNHALRAVAIITQLTLADSINR